MGIFDLLNRAPAEAPGERIKSEREQHACETTQRYLMMHYSDELKIDRTDDAKRSLKDQEWDNKYGKVFEHFWDDLFNNDEYLIEDWYSNPDQACQNIEAQFKERIADLESKVVEPPTDVPLAA